MDDLYKERDLSMEAIRDDTSFTSINFPLRACGSTMYSDHLNWCRIRRAVHVLDWLCRSAS